MVAQVGGRAGDPVVGPAGGQAGAQAVGAQVAGGLLLAKVAEAAEVAQGLAEVEGVVVPLVLEVCKIKDIGFGVI